MSVYVAHMACRMLTLVYVLVIFYGAKVSIDNKSHIHRKYFISLDSQVLFNSLLHPKYSFVSSVFTGIAPLFLFPTVPFRPFPSIYTSRKISTEGVGAMRWQSRTAMRDGDGGLKRERN